jgi:trehalose synthase-fused probable maltokinase
MAAGPTLVETLAGWITDQRWFAGKGATPLLRIIGSLDWYADDDVRIVTHLVLDEGAGRGALYQVPIVHRRTPLADATQPCIGAVTDPSGQTWYAYDGASDPAFARRLLSLIMAGGVVRGEHAQAQGLPGQSAQPPEPGATDAGQGAPERAPRVLASRVLGTEQSNTSIVYTLDTEDGERQVICKLFRTLHHGENPDVVLQSALSAAGSAAVPAVVGSAEARWADTGRAKGEAHGHIAFAQEFLSGARDAWQLALDAAARGEDYRASAQQMGAATAEVHSILASVLPAREATKDDIAETLEAWHGRLDAAIREVPELEVLRHLVETMYARAADAAWPRLQRIHGDLHLGQILARADGRWAIIDFEGEPMRPLASRSLPDVPLRDIAGMLRSFDYVAGTHQDVPGVQGWATACRSAFIDGYTERAGVDVGRHALLLDAFELDKALYEAVYEARNRPDWLHIPIAAVHRLASRAAAWPHAGDSA